MDLSIIIVSWNVKDHLRNCIQSIYRYTTNITFEVFVVDNASADGSADMIEQEFPSVRLIRNAENRGFGAANNQAASQAIGEYILFLNDDTEIHSNIFTPLLTRARAVGDASSDKLGMLGCQLRNPDGTIQESVRAYPTVMDQTIILLKLHHIFPSLVQHYMQSDFDYTSEQSVDQVMGAFMLSSKSVLDKVGYFDEGFFAWFEEVDLQQRIKAAGYSIIYTPLAQCTHVKGASFYQLRKPRAQRMFNASMRYYFKKQHSVFAYLWITAIQPLSVGLAYVAQIFR